MALLNTVKKSMLIKALLVLVILYIGWRLLKKYRGEGFISYDPRQGDWSTLPADRSPWGDHESTIAITPQPAGTTPRPVPGWTGAPPAVSTDLLPKPEPRAVEFGEYAPRGEIIDNNLVDASKLVGVDTIGSSLKNANYGLRRDPLVVKQDVGPWTTSTYTADLLRKSLGDCS